MRPPCDSIAESLPAYIYDDIDEEDRRAIREHVEGCPPCAETLRRFREVHDVLDELPVPPMPARGDLAGRVLARAQALQERRAGVVTLARAAVVLLAIALGGAVTRVALAPGDEGVEVVHLERMITASGENPEMVPVIDELACKRYGVVPYRDPTMPDLATDQLVLLDRDYRILRDRARGESVMLAAYMQLRIGDYYLRRQEDPRAAHTEYVKVFDLVGEGKVHALARSRIENLLKAHPETR